MSEANVEVVRQIYDRWDRQESARDFIAEDVEYVNPPYAVEPGIRRGRASFRVVREIYEDFVVRVEEIIDAGGDDVLVLAHYTASGRGSRVPLEGEHAYVWTVREGQAVRFQWFQSHREAYEAAQLVVCRRFAVEADAPGPDSRLGVAQNLRDRSLWPVKGVRHPPERGTNGWYLFAGDEASQAEDFFDSLHTHHAAEWRPHVLPYLALPPGWGFVIAPGYEDVYYDASLLSV